MENSDFDEIVDVVVVGSGGGALTGAYVAASRGLKTMVLESTEFYGGTTAYSGSGLWLPGNDAATRGGVEDSPDEARAYLRAVVGDDTADMQDAFLAATQPMIAELEEHPMLDFEHRPFPDYFAAAPGMKPMGRDIFPLDLDRSALGDMDEWLRPSAPEERRGFPAPPQLTGGQALIARLLLATRSTGNCDLRLRTAMDSLIVDDGRVVGVDAIVGGVHIRIRARAGVLLAAGGFERNSELRSRYGVPGKTIWSMGAPGGVGRPIQAGVEIGAATDQMDQAWWSPGVVHPDGTATFTLGIRGGIFVNSAGERFMNESLPYDQAGRVVIAAHETGVSHLPFWLVFDNRFGDEMPAMSTVPMLERQAYVDAGLWRSADSLAGLAAEIDVPAAALDATVDRFNKFAAFGVDDDYHRGETPYDQFFAFGGGDPNKALVPIEDGPFHAVQFAVSDLGTKGGLVTDTSGRVLRDDGSVIEGVYAAGNTMAAWSRDTYPAPGTPIGTCMVFSYLAVLDMEHRAAS